MSPAYDPNPRFASDPNVAYDPNLNLDPNADPNLPYDPRAGVEPRVEPLVVAPPTADQLIVFLVAIRRIAPLSARRVIEIIDEFFLHYFPDGVPEPAPPEPPAPVDATIPVTSPEILALATAPKELVAAPAAGSLTLNSADISYTFGTLAYVDAGASAMIKIMCGAVALTYDSPVTFITGGASSSATLSLSGAVPSPNQPLTLAISGGALTGGDGTLSVILNYTEEAGAALDARSIPPYKFGVA